MKPYAIVEEPSGYKNYNLITQEGNVIKKISEEEFTNYKILRKVEVPYITDDYRLVYKIREIK